VTKKPAGATTKPERIIQNEILLVASQQGFTLWRNNTGQAWQGKRTSIDGSTVITRSGRTIDVSRGILLEDYRPVQFGLCEGSSDLIGLKQVTITPGMVGQTFAVFTAVEVKSKRGRPTAKQQQFVDFVTRAGGLASIARSPEDLP